MIWFPSTESRSSHNTTHAYVGHVSIPESLPLFVVFIKKYATKSKVMVL